MIGLTDNLDKFRIELAQQIQFILEKRGVESQFSTDRVIRVEDEAQMFNFEGGRYLVEISENELIDNCGYRYSLDAIQLEELCSVLDSIKFQKKY